MPAAVDDGGIAAGADAASLQAVPAAAVDGETDAAAVAVAAATIPAPAPKKSRRVRPTAAGPQFDPLLVGPGTDASDQARHCVSTLLTDPWEVQAWRILIDEAQADR